MRTARCSSGPPIPGPAASSAAVIASQRRLEGEERGDVADRVEEARADRAGGNEREEGDRQGDHEGEQRDRPHLARRRPERRPGRPERRAAGDDRQQPEPEPAPVRAGRRSASRPASAASRRGRRATPSRTFSPSSAEGGDEAAGEPREGVLLPLERQRAGDQEDGDEGQGQGRGDRDREDFQRRASRRRPPPCRPRSAAPGGRSAARRRRGCRAARAANSVTSVERGAQRPAAAPARTASRIRGAGPQAEDLDRLRRAPSNSPPLTSRFEVSAAFVGDPPRDHAGSPAPAGR